MPSEPPRPEALIALHRRVHAYAHVLGDLCAEAFHYIALFAIGATIVWSAYHAFRDMAEIGRASIDDVLLLFIYLELGAMVGIYFKTTHMPVRFLIYVGITALVRLMIAHVQAHHQPDVETLLLAGAILLMAVATLIIRIGSARFPAPSHEPPDGMR